MIAVSLIILLLVILVLFVAIFILLAFRRKVRIARMGPPQSRITHSGESVTDDKPKTSEVIGMIKCEYCGSLMPQSATVCSNCGASRKE